MLQGHAPSQPVYHGLLYQEGRHQEGSMVTPISRVAWSVLPGSVPGSVLHVGSVYRVISNLSRYDLVQFAPQNTQRR